MQILVNEGSLPHRLLTGTLAVTTDRERAVRSRLCWFRVSRQGQDIYLLRPLGILHGLFGISLYVKEKRP